MASPDGQEASQCRPLGHQEAPTLPSVGRSIQFPPDSTTSGRGDSQSGARGGILLIFTGVSFLGHQLPSMTTITPAWCQHGPVHVALHLRSHCPWTWGTMDVMVAKMIPRLQEAPCSHRTKVGWSMWQFPKITELLDMGNHGSHGSRHSP